MLEQGLKTSDYDYELPEHLIAQSPLLKRDESRLMLVNTSEVATKGLSALVCEDKQFKDLIDLLNAGDVLVLNETKVLPARLLGLKKQADKQSPAVACEVLLLKRLNETDWECLVKPGRRLKVGTEIIFIEKHLEQSSFSAQVLEVLDNGNRLIRFSFEGIFEEVLDKAGKMPLPPYIHEVLEDKNRYQTIYAKNQGSAAAPTAGLHFTPQLLQNLEEKGVQIEKLTLHVGLGTFRPVKTEDILEHTMHEEAYELSSETAQRLNQAILEGRRIIAVGTTTTRVLESVAYLQDGHFLVKAGQGTTNIFIYPGKKIKIVDALITNFHLPKSTLLMLVSALAGRQAMLNVYEQAVKREYRFFSFGDAMFIQNNMTKQGENYELPRSL